MDATECLSRAQHCEQIAATMIGEKRQAVLRIARDWRELAAKISDHVPPEEYKPDGTPRSDLR